MVSVGGHAGQREDSWLILSLCPTNYIISKDRSHHLSGPRFSLCKMNEVRYINLLLGFITRRGEKSILEGLFSEAPKSKTLCGINFHPRGASISDSINMTAFDKYPQSLYDGRLSIPITGPEEKQPGETSLQRYVPEGGGRVIKGNDQSLTI